MRSTRPVLTILSFLLLISVNNISARAADDDGEDYDVKARVVRISLIKGEVTLKRLGNSDWERARLNFPLVEGDTFATDNDARVEFQIDARNFVRVGANSILRIVTLRDEGVALSLVEGTTSVRLAKFDSDREYFEVDAPKTTLAAEKKGLYRIDVARDGRVRLTVRDDGRARIYSETSGFALRDGRAAELIVDGSGAGDWELLAAGARDSWDTWIDDRERYLAERMRYDTQYYDNYVWGAEDLDAYGNWSYTNDYGWIWQPHVTVINNYNSWAPYRYGSWTWCPPYGWTWVGYEPWGWAPYHYGRWVYHNNYWAWCPRSQYYRHRSWWRPALVAFNISFGNHVSWYPLSYYHRDPRSRYYGSNGLGNRLSPLRANELANLRRVNPAYLRAVTAVPAKDFGGESARSQPANQALAQRVINAEPLRGDIPVRPARAFPSEVDAGASTDRVTVARPARVTPARELPERPTGAAERTPGIALDNELRRTRVLNGREPRSLVPSENTSGATETRPTGAVARPARPVREPSSRSGEIERGIPQNVEPGERSARPNRTYPRQDRTGTPDADEPVRRETRPSGIPVRPPAIESPAESPAPGRVERPAGPDRGADRNPDRSVEPTERRERVERPAPPERRERVETPEPRHVPPARTHEPPAQRSEPPARYEPPARSEPPPQRADPPQQRPDPPAHRSEPTPSQSEPKSEPRSAPAKPAPDRPERPSRGERKEG